MGLSCNPLPLVRSSRKEYCRGDYIAVRVNPVPGVAGVRFCNRDNPELSSDQNTSILFKSDGTLTAIGFYCRLDCKAGNETGSSNDEEHKYML